MNKKGLKQLSERKAQEAVDFFSALKLTKGKFHGVYFEPLPWQEKIIRDIYGTLKPDGRRQYKEAWIELPKKNGKSEMVAGFALKQLCADNEMLAEVYGCAADKQQASIVFDVAVEMVEQEPEIKKHCTLVISRKRIIYLPTKSFYQVCSSEAYNKHGLNVSGCVFDEIHAQPNRALFDVMTFGSGDAREQPLFVYITTSGDDPDRMSIGWELHKKAEDIILGTRVDPSFYSVIFGYDEDLKRVWEGWSYKDLKPDTDKNYWRNENLWMRVNPSMNHTINLDTIKGSYQKIDGDESQERLFKQLRLNIWVKYKTTKWVPGYVWEQNGGLIPQDVDPVSGLIMPKMLEHMECYGGLDLSSKLDISAFVLIFTPDDDTGKYYVLPYFWIPEDNMHERVKKDKVRYNIWADQGLLRPTPGNIIDYRQIEKDILTLKNKYDIKEIGFDPWNAYDIQPTLQEEGLIMVEVRQTFKHMDGPMKELEALLKGKHVNHGNNPVLNWHFGNLEVITDTNGNVRPCKAVRGSNSVNKTGYQPNRIDGIVALVNAMARLIFYKDKKSVYEDRGLVDL